jgi:hypothetical protein
VGAIVQEQFRHIVDAVAARMRRPVLLRLAALSLLAGAGLGLLLALARLVGGWEVLRWFAIGAVVVVPLAGVVWASRHKVDPLAAVRAIDAHYGLKSRAVTLWSFLRLGNLDEARRMAVDDAWRHVKNVEPAKVVPVAVPKTVYAGAGAVLLVVILAFLPVAWFHRAAELRDRATVVVEAAEMTRLAPLPKVTAEVAARSTQGVSSVSPATDDADSSLLTAGFGDVVGRFFDATQPPPSEP